MRIDHRSKFENKFYHITESIQEENLTETSGESELFDSIVLNAVCVCVKSESGCVITEYIVLFWLHIV